MPLNLAEGAAEYAPDEKARFYRMARRSAAECVAILDILDGVKLKTVEVRRRLAEVAALLTALIRRHSTAPRPPQPEP